MGSFVKCNHKDVLTPKPQAMINKATTLVTTEFLKETKLKDEYFYRQLSFDIINKMPFDDLKKIFEFNKIDPYSDESATVIKRQIGGYNVPLFDDIMDLREKRMIKYEAEIYIPKPHRPGHHTGA